MSAQRSQLSVAAVSAFLFGLAGVNVSLAQEVKNTPAENERAMPGMIHMGSATPARAKFVLSGGLGYGFLDETDAWDGGHRAFGSVGAAFAPVPAFAFGLDLRGHLDAYGQTDNGSETNLYGEPRLNARFSSGINPDLYWGAALDFRLVGAEAPSIDFPSTSPTLRGLLTAQLNPGTWLSSQLGVHIDRSAEAVPDPGVLSPADQRSLGASSWNAVVWGLGVSHALESKTELLAEVGGQFLIGANAPAAGESPLAASVGARHPLSHNISAMALADVSFSARPDAVPTDDMIPMLPRFSVGALLIWRLDESDKPAKRPKVEPRPEPEPEPVVEPEPPPTKSITGKVVDEGGRPLADVELTLTPADGEPVVERSYADGSFEFKDVPADAQVEIKVMTPGYDDVTLEVGKDEVETREVVMRPSVPAGQVKGKVLDLQGNPIQAKITVTPGSHDVEVTAEGAFDLLLSPGRYTVKFEHEDYTTQVRKIRVKNRSVVILNIALER